MNVKRRVLGEISANCYMISTDKAAIVIDPGCYSPEISDFLKDNADKERLILLTHGHFDHIGGAARLRGETGTPIAIGEKDAPALSDPFVNLSSAFGCALEPFSADKTVADGEKITVGDIELTAIETPGHTVGGTCYFTDGILFSGDILFEGSVGRTDFPGGSTAELMRSISRLLELDGSTRVLSGHGRETTVDTERIYNPYIGRII